MANHRLMNSYVFAYATGVLSIAAGLIYWPNLFNSSHSFFFESVPELADGQQLIELWSAFAIYGGISIIIITVLFYAYQRSMFKRSLQGLSLLSMLLVIVAQFPPLFWWILVSGASFSWSSMLGLSIHLILLGLPFMTLLLLLNAIVQVRYQATS